MAFKHGCWLLVAIIFLIAGVVVVLSALFQSHISGPGAPLEGIVNGFAALLGLVLLVASGLTFAFRPKLCFPELLEHQITPDHMRLVTEHTSITFPKTAKLVAVCHRDKSLAAYVAAKFVLPSSDREEFMENPIFGTGLDRPPHFELGSSTLWWKRNDLKSRVDRVQHLPSGVYVECSIGIEGDQTVVYVSWA